MIAPIVIVAIMLAYYIVFGWLVLAMPTPWGLKLGGGIVAALLSGVAVYVLVERIREIRSGEEDDLDNY